MALHHMFNDRQPEPGAPGVARAAAVNAVETFGQPRQVFTRYADAAVADLDLARAIFAPTPAQDGWRFVARERRPTERDESVLIYRRMAATP